jgi:sugar lactone lactonase YvrE
VRKKITTAVAAVGALLVPLLTPVAVAGPAESAEEAGGERPRWHTRVFSRVPNPGYPAFVYAHPNGRVYVGTYNNPKGDDVRSRVLEWTADGTLQRSWTVPGQNLSKAHGVQVATSDARGRLVLLEKSTSRALMLNPRNGRFTRYATFRDLPLCGPGEAKGCSPNLVDKPATPNFAAWGPRGELYVTDYGQAVIWRVPPGGGKARVWLADRRLDGVEFGTTGMLLAPNRRALLVAQQTSAGLGELNPTTGKLYRIPIRDGGPGDMRVVWESLPGDLPDGFGIGRSGRIYLANAGLSAQIVVLGPDGTELERFPEAPLTGDNRSEIPFDTPSSATFLGRRILVANQSYLGSGENHAVLDVAVGERGKPVFVPRTAGYPR